MAVARRRFVKIALQSAAVLVVPLLKLSAPVVPWVQAIRSRRHLIPVKRLSPDEVKRPGHWGG